MLWEYLRVAPPSAIRDSVETLAGPALLRCVHTHAGAAVACSVIAYGTPKDRKKAVKSMKGARLAAGLVTGLAAGLVTGSVTGSVAGWFTGSVTGLVTSSVTGLVAETMCGG